MSPEIERQQAEGKEIAFRAEAAFAKPEIYEALKERGVKYALRGPANETLERDIAELLNRPVGQPSHKPLHRFRANEVRLQMSVLAYNLGNLWRGWRCRRTLTLGP